MESGFSYPLPDVYDALEFPVISILDTRTKQALAHISNKILSWLKNSMAVFINISEEKKLYAIVLEVFCQTIYLIKERLIVIGEKSYVFS